MAWLFIDTHAAHTYRCGGLDPLRSRIKTRAGRASRLLFELERLMAGLERIDGICVVVGPGSFSAIRVGVLYANLLARIRRWPLVGVSVEEAQDVQRLAGALVAGKLPPSALLAPIYDAEPNITRPRAPHV